MIIASTADAGTFTCLSSHFYADKQNTKFTQREKKPYYSITAILQMTFTPKYLLVQWQP